jgi:hypothetical protein
MNYTNNKEGFSANISSPFPKFTFSEKEIEWHETTKYFNDMLQLKDASFIGMEYANKRINDEFSEKDALEFILVNYYRSFDKKQLKVLNILIGNQSDKIKFSDYIEQLPDELRGLTRHEREKFLSKKLKLKIKSSNENEVTIRSIGTRSSVDLYILMNYCQ